MITAAQEVEKNALNDPEDVQATLDDAQAKFFTISQAGIQALAFCSKTS